jgi:ribonuclease BN (tRNA processing enzyme)
MIDSFGYRFETPGRTIVISGDTAPAQTIVDHGRGCDVLIHEVYSMATYHQVSSRSQRFRRNHHTSSVELAEIANTVRPGLLVIYHRSNAGGGASSADREDVLLEEIRRDYGGAVVAAHDLDVF